MQKDKRQRNRGGVLFESEWVERLRKVSEKNQRSMVGQVKAWIEREEKELPVVKA